MVRQSKGHAASTDACMENSQSDPPNVSAVQEVQTVVEEPSNAAAVQPITVSDQPEVVPSQTPVNLLASTAPAPVVTKEDSLDRNPDAPSEGQEGENKPSTPSQSAPSAISGQNYVPPTKRFKAVNINNKFLKTQNTATTGVGSAASSSSKQSGAIARPTPQTTQSHSRLVTTKLTATPLSSSPGAGWTRPNSVTPPASSPGSAPGQAKGAPTLTTVGGHGPPQITPGGKIIQPQVLKQKVEGAARPAWRSVQSGANSVPTQGDFPTAAEAAQTRAMRNAEVKAAVMAVEAQKQAMSETADAFRGVHLDPNAHHWDEVDDDNDDFLGGVIEFGDGRQYTIQVNEGVPRGPSATDGSRDAPVSKADRFADDYDRSWPKARGGEQGQLPHDGHGRQNWASQSETSSNAPHSPVSMREGHPSKLLFNERSNRMEPFSGKQHAPSTHAPPHIATRKASHDSSSRFNHTRFERDAPPHANMVHDDGQGNFRGQGIPTGHPNGFSDRQSRPDWNSHSRHANDASSIGREPSLSRSSVHESQSVAGDDVAGRHGNAWGAQRHGPTREMPPHLAQAQSRSPFFETRDLHPASERSPQNSRSNLPPTIPNAPGGQGSQPSAANPPPMVPSPEELATLRKAFLADNAEKAKKRRQEEEEERQRAQERAKEKAAKLAALMEAPKAVTSKPSPEARTKEIPTVQANDAQVLDIIEEAVKSVTEAGKDKQGPINGRPMARRLSSARSVDHQPTSPVSSTHPRAAAEPTVAERADSWRSATKPKPAVDATEIPTATAETKQTMVQAALPEVRAFEFETEGHTEVLDFSEMGSLSKDVATPTRPSRPVASDYFTGPPPKSYSAVAEGRLHASVTESQSHVAGATPFSNGHILLTPTGVKALRTPNANFKEAPLSTLDDTMSRIKGALDGMHVHDEAGPGDSAPIASNGTGSSHIAIPPPQSSSTVPPRLSKWLPPALRPQGADFRHRRTEDFTNTSHAPPMDSLLPNDRPVVQLPKTCKTVSSVSKKQLLAFRAFYGPVRWEILSFDPPVEGMSKKSLSVNDVLFKKPVGTYKQRKYRVHLPRRRYSPRQRERELRSANKAEQPQESTRETAAGAFGRPKVDGSAPWRSPEISTVPEVKAEDDQTPASLNVTSRSPPPDVPSAKASEKRTPEASIVPLQVSASLESSSFTVGKDDPVVISSKPAGVIGQSPKRVVSEGSAKIETYVETKVSFTPRGMSKPLPGSATISPSFRKLELGHPEASGETIASIVNAPTHTATPPPQQSASTWAKSPARVPDPEHLKAVWSQPASKGPLPGVNSLKGIADDLTSVPFTLHEVKSESGTPPPTSSGSSVAHPSRMTASEVTRAFQTVPTAPANSAPTPSSRPAHLPPNASSPIISERSLKATATGLPPPSMYPSPGGQAYYYASPVSNHSPSPPTMVYSNVMQNGVAASPASPYAQPVWMPVMQQPGQQMLRPQPSSPYSPQLIPYQTTGPQNGMMRPPTNGYVQNPAGTPGTYGGTPAPGQMIVSPVMHHATPAQPMVYPGSPMLVHVSGPAPGSVAQHAQQRPYPQGVVGVGRGGVPVNSQTHPYSHQHQIQTHVQPQGMHPVAHAGHHPHVRYPAPNPGYNVPHAYVPQQW